MSQQIKDLEDELGTAPFNGPAVGCELTAAGTGLLEQARAIQAEHAGLQTRAIGLRAGWLISIGTTGSVLLGSLAELIAAFGERHPGVVVRIHQMGPLEQQTALLNHRIDICFIRRPGHEPNLITELAGMKMSASCCPKRTRWQNTGNCRCRR